MAISSDLNRISVLGDFSMDDCFRLLAAMHSSVTIKGYHDIHLDFSRCTKAFAAQMLPISARAQSYWKSGIDIQLTLPDDDKLRALFRNTNWAHLIDFRSFDQSRYRGYTHAPAIRFGTAAEQFQASNKILDLLLAALQHFRRDDLRSMEWAVNEITDNVINHSESEVGGIIQITNHRQRQQIEFVVCDCGIGIPTTLRGSYPELRTDQEALDLAIREGVTRDKTYGQGNGLYGTWRITQKSGGLFQVLSGHASLTSDQVRGISIKNQEIPMNGTLVVSRIGYSERFDLSDALVFGGRRHVPVDYIETHFEEDERGNVTFNLKSESNGFGSRAAGEPVRRKLVNVLNCGISGKTIVDMYEIPLVSSSYADEVFGKLFVELGPIDFASRIELKNVDPLVRNLIDRAIFQRMKQ